MAWKRTRRSFLCHFLVRLFTPRVCFFLNSWWFKAGLFELYWIPKKKLKAERKPWLPSPSYGFWQFQTTTNIQVLWVPGFCRGKPTARKNPWKLVISWEKPFLLPLGLFSGASCAFQATLVFWGGCLRGVFFWGVLNVPLPRLQRWWHMLWSRGNHCIHAWARKRSSGNIHRELSINSKGAGWSSLPSGATVIYYRSMKKNNYTKYPFIKTTRQPGSSSVFWWRKKSSTIVLSHKVLTLKLTGGRWDGCFRK